MGRGAAGDAQRRREARERGLGLMSQSALVQASPIVNTYPCPDWLRCRKISDGEYGIWLEKQTRQVWNREAQKQKHACASRQALKLVLHQAASESTGYDPYSGTRFFVKHMRRGWVDSQAHLNGNRHYRTLRRAMPTFDHVNGLGKCAYELCTWETNSAKSFMSPTQFVDLCRRVAGHRGPTDRLAV